MTGPTEKIECCFPLTSMFSSASPQGNIEGLMETKLSVSLGASHEVLNVKGVPFFVCSQFRAEHPHIKLSRIPPGK